MQFGIVRHLGLALFAVVLLHLAVAAAWAPACSRDCTSRRCRRWRRRRTVSLPFFVAVAAVAAALAVRHAAAVAAVLGSVLVELFGPVVAFLVVSRSARCRRRSAPAVLQPGAQPEVDAVVVVVLAVVALLAVGDLAVAAEGPPLALGACSRCTRGCRWRRRRCSGTSTVPSPQSHSSPPTVTPSPQVGRHSDFLVVKPCRVSW